MATQGQGAEHQNIPFHSHIGTVPANGGSASPLGQMDPLQSAQQDPWGAARVAAGFSQVNSMNPTRNAWVGNGHNNNPRRHRLCQ